MTQKPSLFTARPRWERWLRRQWRTKVKRHLPGEDRHGIPHASYGIVVSPSEWSQETADAAIKRGQELAEKYGW